MLADINIEGAERLAAILNERHGEKTALAVEVDLRAEQQIEQLVQRTVDHFGAPDIVVNIAGIFPIDDGDIAGMQVEVWDNVFAVNLRSAMLLTKHTLPYLREKGGSIINTASTHAFAGDSSLSGYGATKAAIIALTKYTATQYGKEGVRANVICPGTTTTPPAQQLPQPIKDIYLEHTMAKALNSPTELGKAFLFLASDDSRGINGEVIRVDGGLLANQPFVPDMNRLGMATASSQ
ncbi:SDR family oxidoreductase [Gordonia sp. ABSL1-1]|uniref:SDR family NAD(P)-dependent oxidoreductase n=1 Tax=Gordonia sp. ABSL1-1 TaxID=3053923 RepID=UPI00257326E3|nr:SDR family oxidoreductase [Gordonia sp. ABSL1-1]MDL9935397.1 SDR family oxidoreductase [Gordonia sp. ABSL1-1]